MVLIRLRTRKRSLNCLVFSFRPFGTDTFERHPADAGLAPCHARAASIIGTHIPRTGSMHSIAMYVFSVGVHECVWYKTNCNTTVERRNDTQHTTLRTYCLLNSNSTQHTPNNSTHHASPITLWLFPWIQESPVGLYLDSNDYPDIGCLFGIHSLYNSNQFAL